MSSAIVLVYDHPVAEYENVPWLNHWLAGQLSDETRRNYCSDIEQFMEWSEGRDLTEIKRNDIYEYRSWLVHHEKKYKTTTINRKLTSIRQLFAEAVKQGMIGVSPADGIRGFKGDTIYYSSTKSPEEGQVMQLLDNLNGDDPVSLRDRAILYILFAMGLRRAELCGLTLGSIATDQGHLVLRVTGKGNKRREITLPLSVYGAIKRWTDAMYRESAPKSTPLFQGLKKNGHWKVEGKPLTGDDLYYIVTKRFSEVGIEDCSPHSCRHFFLTYILRHGASIYECQAIAGHNSVASTERYVANAKNLDSSAAKFVDF